MGKMGKIDIRANPCRMKEFSGKNLRIRASRSAASRRRRLSKALQQLDLRKL